MKNPIKEKGKHDHKGTECLKLILFSILMLMPLLSVMFSCLYTTFNENAKDSFTTGQTIQNVQKIDNANSLMVGANYTFNYYAAATGNQSPVFTYNTISINPYEYGANTAYTYTKIRTFENGAVMFIDSESHYSLVSNVWGTRLTTFTINYKEISDQSYFGQGAQAIYYTQYRQASLNDTFYIAANEVANNELFAWSKNTAVFSTIKAVTNGLNVNNDFYPILFAYWFIIVCVYIIIDLIMKVFTIITHIGTSAV